MRLFFKRLFAKFFSPPTTSENLIFADSEIIRGWNVFLSLANLQKLPRLDKKRKNYFSLVRRTINFDQPYIDVEFNEEIVSLFQRICNNQNGYIVKLRNRYAEFLFAKFRSKRGIERESRIKISKERDKK